MLNGAWAFIGFALLLFFMIAFFGDPTIFN